MKFLKRNYVFWIVHVVAGILPYVFCLIVKPDLWSFVEIAFEWIQSGMKSWVDQNDIFFTQLMHLVGGAVGFIIIAIAICFAVYGIWTGSVYLGMSAFPYVSKRMFGFLSLNPLIISLALVIAKGILADELSTNAEIYKIVAALAMFDKKELFGLAFNNNNLILIYILYFICSFLIIVGCPACPNCNSFIGVDRGDGKLYNTSYHTTKSRQYMRVGTEVTTTTTYEDGIEVGSTSSSLPIYESYMKYTKHENNTYQHDCKCGYCGYDFYDYTSETKEVDTWNAKY